MKKNVLFLSLLVFLSGLSATTIPSGYSVSELGSFVTTSPGFGGLEADADGNVYMVGDYSDKVYKYNASNQTFSQFCVTPSTNNLSVTLYNDYLYVGNNSGSIYKVNSSGSVSTFTTLSGTVNKMVLAPSGWGSYGNKMITATSNGLYSVDMNTGSINTIISGGIYDGIQFNSNNELLATKYDSNIYKISPTGSITSFFTIPGSADSIAIHPGTGEILTTAPNTTIYKTDADGSNTTAFITGLTISVGWYPSGIDFSPDGSTLYYSEINGNYKLYALTGFSTVNPVPEPSTFFMAVIFVLLAAKVIRK